MPRKKDRAVARDNSVSLAVAFWLQILLLSPALYKRNLKSWKSCHVHGRNIYNQAIRRTADFEPADANRRHVVMASVIKQSVTLPASAKKLYDMYITSRGHAAITGAPAIISAKPGSPFSAFGGSIFGATVAVVPGRLIVQSWRSCNFAEADPDSTLILSFTPLKSNSARIDLVHLNVSEVDYDGVRKGWQAYYWKPWRKALAKK
jgi:activator of HSP90 ATPase